LEQNLAHKSSHHPIIPSSLHKNLINKSVIVFYLGFLRFFVEINAQFWNKTILNPWTAS
jgi:threonine/homoserine/homoserine lactone efflux protein